MTGSYADLAPQETRIQDLQARLVELRRADSATLRTRLAHAHPWHITRVARAFFLGLTVLCVVLLAGSVAVPLLLTDAALMIRDMQEALPLPLPMLILFLALLMAVAWVTAGQAALAIARDCPLLPREQEECRKLESELSILTQGQGIGGGASGLVAGIRPDTPPPLHMPASRLSSGQRSTGNYAAKADYPSPVPTAGGTLRYAAQPSFPPPIGAKTPGGRPSYLGADTQNDWSDHGSGGWSDHGSGSWSEPGAATRTPAPSLTRKPSPGLSYRSPDGRGRSTPRPVARTHGGEPNDPDSELNVVQYERRPHDSYTISPNSPSQQPLDGPGTASWHQPRFAAVDEAWLQDALQKAQSLSARYPVQAFLEYSVEPDLPFTLVLERATPAMAVRGMVDFVGFLASISTPRRARIELRSVVHLDRSFYRSVMSAMEPYFPDTVDIRQQGYRVEIQFLEPDPNWARYPILPIDA